MSHSPWKYCIAPMMDWSDRHCRYFWRLISKHARLYTEMVVTGAILHGDQERFLGFDAAEHPIALQLGGSDPKELAECAKIGEEWGYDEINLNCGCPSDRVQKGKIGAILMQEPELVAECISAMKEQTTVPVTIKHRIGVDEHDSYDALTRFVSQVAESGCEVFIVHARKAWLKGLSPKENREIPPLKYEIVNRLKADFPNLVFVINGGIDNIDQAKTLLNTLDGVMVGREAYSNPYSLSAVDQSIFNASELTPSRDKILEQYALYCDNQIQNGTRLHHMSRHILGLYSGQPGGRLFRRYISEHAPRQNAPAHTLLDAVNAMNRGT